MNVIHNDAWRDFIIDDDTYLGDITTAEDAHNARLNLLEQCAKIRAQLDADAIDNSRGRDWRMRAKKALAFKGVAMQRLQLMASRMTKQENIALSKQRDERLIRAMRDYIGEEAFFRIVDSLNTEEAA